MILKNGTGYLEILNVKCKTINNFYWTLFRLDIDYKLHLTAGDANIRRITYSVLYGCIMKYGVFVQELMKIKISFSPK